MTFDINSEEILSTITKHYYPLSKECMGEFLEFSSPRIFAANEVIIEEGKTTQKAFFIVKGSLRAFYIKEGREITDWFAFENEFISGINSYFEGVPSQHSIQALEPAYCIEIGKNEVEKLATKYPEFVLLINRVLEHTILKLQRRIFSLQFATAYQRYNDLLAQFPEINQRVALKHIASYLGITLETLSRIRNPNYRI